MLLRLITRRSYPYRFYNSDAKITKRKFPIKTLTSFLMISSGGFLIYAYYDRKGRIQIEEALPYSNFLLNYLIGDINRNPNKKGVLVKFGDEISTNYDNIHVKLNTYISKTTKDLYDLLPSKNHKKDLKTNLSVIEEPLNLFDENKNFLNNIMQHKTNVINSSENYIKLSHQYIDCLNNLNSGLKDLLEKTSLDPEEEKNKWNDIANFQECKGHVADKREKAFNDYMNKFKLFNSILLDGKNKDALDHQTYQDYQRQMDKLEKKLKIMENDLEEAESKSRTYIQSFKLLTDSKTQFDKELKALHPKFELGKWTLLGTDYSKDDLSTLLVHAYKKVNLFQKELAKEKAESIENLSRLLKDQKDKLIQQYSTEMRTIIAREKENFTAEKEKEIARIQQEFDKKLNTNVNEQGKQFQDKVNAMLSQQRQELVKINETQIQDIKLQETSKNEMLRKEYISKMEGIERALDHTFEARKQFMKVSKLWILSSTMLQLLDGYHRDDASIIDKASQLIDPTENITDEELVWNLEREIPVNLITQQLSMHVDGIIPFLRPQGGKDENLVDDQGDNLDLHLLTSIARSFSKLQTSTDKLASSEFPRDAINDFESFTPSIQTLRNLCERWGNVKRVCSRVAMIDDPNSSLMRYFFSYIQSFFVIEPSLSHVRSIRYVRSTVGDDALVNNENDSTSKINKILERDIRFEGDTFEILALADYYIRVKTDFLTAIKALNLLKGQPRLVADGWIRDVQTHLEVCQNLKLLRSLSLFVSAREAFVHQNILTQKEKQKTA